MNSLFWHELLDWVGVSMMTIASITVMYILYALYRRSK